MSYEIIKKMFVDWNSFFWNLKFNVSKNLTACFVVVILFFSFLGGRMVGGWWWRRGNVLFSLFGDRTAWYVL